MHGHKEKRTDQRYKTGAALIVSPTFNFSDYYCATELNLIITDFGELDFYQAQAIVGGRMTTHNILILLVKFA